MYSNNYFLIFFLYIFSVQKKKSHYKWRGVLLGWAFPWGPRDSGSCLRSLCLQDRRGAGGVPGSQLGWERGWGALGAPAVPS